MKKKILAIVLIVTFIIASGAGCDSFSIKFGNQEFNNYLLGLNPKEKKHDIGNGIEFYQLNWNDSSVFTSIQHHMTEKGYTAYPATVKDGWESKQSYTRVEIWEEYGQCRYYILKVEQGVANAIIYYYSKGPEIIAIGDTAINAGLLAIKDPQLVAKSNLHHLLWDENTDIYSTIVQYMDQSSIKNNKTSTTSTQDAGYNYVGTRIEIFIESDHVSYAVQQLNGAGQAIYDTTYKFYPDK